MTRISTVSASLLLLLLCIATGPPVCCAVPLDCSPDQYQINFRIDTFAQATAVHGFGRLHVDRRVSNLTVMNITMAGHNFTETALYINNLSSNISYKWLPSTGHCSSWPLLCNQDFSLINSAFLGAASDKMEASVFWASSGLDSATLVATKDLCIPLFTSQQSALSLSAMSFFNATLGIQDPEVFRVPDQCGAAHSRQRRSIIAFGFFTVY